MTPRRPARHVGRTGVGCDAQLIPSPGKSTGTLPGGTEVGGRWLGLWARSSPGMTPGTIETPALMSPGGFGNGFPSPLAPSSAWSCLNWPPEGAWALTSDPEFGLRTVCRGFTRSLMPFFLLLVSASSLAFATRFFDGSLCQ